LNRLAADPAVRRKCSALGWFNSRFESAADS
jgi:hypothetical protein